MPSTSPEITYTSSAAQKLFRVSVSEPTHRHDTTYVQHQHPEPRRNSAGDVLPEVSLKWGRSPKSGSSPEIKASGHGYSEAEVTKMRAKGINPDLKWEREHGRGGERKKKGGFWGKVAGTWSGTCSGGGVIK
jgi:hypothetical protein